MEKLVLPATDIYIPTLNDTHQDYEVLFSIFKQATKQRTDIRFDFSWCKFLRPNAVAFRVYIKERGRIIFPL